MQHESGTRGEILDFRPGADMTWEIVRADDALETINSVGPGTGGPPVHRPALEYEAFFRRFHRLVSTGAIKMPPKDPRSLLYFGVQFSAYPDLQRTVRPPQAVSNLLGRVGRALGLRAGTTATPSVCSTSRSRSRRARTSTGSTISGCDAGTRS